MDISKFRGAVVDLWRFLFPGLMTTAALWLILIWVAPIASSLDFSGIKLIVHLPNQPTRDALAFFGVVKLMPLTTAVVLGVSALIAYREPRRHSANPTIDRTPQPKQLTTVDASLL